MPFEIVKPDTHIDFIGKRRVAFAVSVLLLLASLVAVGVRGVRLGIDFAGGTEIQVRFDAGVTADEGRLRQAISAIDGIEGLSVIRYGEADANEFLVKFQGGESAMPVDVAAEDAAAVVEAIESADPGEEAAEVAEEVAPQTAEAVAAVEEEAAEVADTADAAVEPAEEIAEPVTGDLVIQVSQVLDGAVGPHSLERVEFVGPRVGAELRDDGLRALLFASVVILIYIAFRFSSRFAPGAIVAVLHDLLITAGIFVILGMEFDLRILAAMLAILGYSLNDTIIIYDRIRENMELRTKVDLPEVLNESVNQTLSRTVLTSGTTLAALLSLLFLGGEVIRPFAFAMTVGVIVGTYSSVYIAAPTLLFLEQRYGGVVSGKPARA